MNILKSKKIFILLNIAFIVMSMVRFTNYMDNFVSSIILASIMLINIYIFFSNLEKNHVKWRIKAIIFIMSVFSMLLILTLINARDFSSRIDKSLFLICVLIPNIIYSTISKKTN